MLVVTGLPIAAWMRARALDVGLATQSWPDWAVDVREGGGDRRGHRRASAVSWPWRWCGASRATGGRRPPLLVVAYGVVTIWLYPILIDPVFNRFDRLPQGKLRSEVLQLADRAGVDVGQVYRVDASRRTSAANAYVIGLGHSKRVVLYDNLIDDFKPGEVRTVVAHELGHQKHDDLLRGLAWLAIVAPAGTFLVQAPVGALRRQASGSARRPALPAIALAIALVSLGLGCASNALSRQGGGERGLVRAAAHARPEGLHRLPAPHLGPERGRPGPAPAGTTTLFDTHPTTLERIGAGVAVRVQVGCRRPCHAVPS